jgi:hypothetical protein
MWIVDKELRVEASQPFQTLIESRSIDIKMIVQRSSLRHHRSQGKLGQNSEKFVCLIRTR